ncbi:hypothetical protein J2T13_005125 [Paenibacillus sp. DS2015]
MCSLKSHQAKLISDAQAKQLASCICSGVKLFIEQHSDLYLEFINGESQTLLDKKD